MRYVKERIVGQLAWALREFECAERLYNEPTASYEEACRVTALYDERRLTVEKLEMMEKVCDMSADELVELRLSCLKNKRVLLMNKLR